MKLELAQMVATMQDQVHKTWVQQIENARYERNEARK
jgi:hypothetical protein